MNNPNFQEQLNQYKEEYFSEVYGESGESEEEEEEVMEENSEQIVEGCTIVNDEEQIKEFKRISPEECISLSQKEKKFQS